MPSATVTVTVGKVMRAMTRIVGRWPMPSTTTMGMAHSSGGMPWKKSTTGFSSASAPRREPTSTPAATPVGVARGEAEAHPHHGDADLPPGVAPGEQRRRVGERGPRARDERAAGERRERPQGEEQDDAGRGQEPAFDRAPRRDRCPVARIPAHRDGCRP